MNIPLESQTGAQPGNPFLEKLEPYLSTNDLQDRLQNWPLAGLDIPNLSITARHDLLDVLDLQMFEPTLTSLDTTTRLYRMIRKWYIARDPTQVSSRAHLMKLARYAGKELKDLPWLRIPRQTGHPFHGKLDTWSSANWTPIPRQTGHPVQRKLDTGSAPNWTV